MNDIPSCANGISFVDLTKIFDDHSYQVKWVTILLNWD